MDTLQFQPGWIDSDRDWMEEEMKQFLSNHRDWVIDGNYSWCYYEGENGASRPDYLPEFLPLELPL